MDIWNGTDARYDHASKSGSHPQLCYKTEAGEFLPRASAWITMIEVLDYLYYENGTE
jgi:hypothetical protein